MHYHVVTIRFSCFKTERKTWIGADMAPQPQLQEVIGQQAWMVCSLLLFKIILVRDYFPPVLTWYTILRDTPHQQLVTKYCVSKGTKREHCHRAWGKVSLLWLQSPTPLPRAVDVEILSQLQRGTWKRKKQRIPLLRLLPWETANSRSRSPSRSSKGRFQIVLTSLCTTLTPSPRPSQAPARTQPG